MKKTKNDVNVTIITIIIISFGTVLKKFAKEFEELESQKHIGTIWMTAFNLVDW